MQMENVSRVGFGGCSVKNKKEVLDRLCSLTEGKKVVVDDGWGYSGELVNTKFLGDYISTHERDKFIIIEKLPLFDGLYQKLYNKSLYNCSDKELEQMIIDVFNKQLEALKTDYIDCYLLHAIFDFQFHPDFDIDKDIALYKRITPILLKLKKEGKVKALGFSCHITYSRLLEFLTEVDPNNEIFSIAEVSYNTLNDKGFDPKNPSAFVYMLCVNVWPAIGEKGIKLLKSKGYDIIDMMPHEGGRLLEISTAPDFISWNDRFIMSNNNISVVLEGTSNPENINKMLIAAGEIENPNPIPDMRVLGVGLGHCSE